MTQHQLIVEDTSHVYTWQENPMGATKAKWLLYGMIARPHPHDKAQIFCWNICTDSLTETHQNRVQEVNQGEKRPDTFKMFFFFHSLWCLLEIYHLFTYFHLIFSTLQEAKQKDRAEEAQLLSDIFQTPEQNIAKIFVTALAVSLPGVGLHQELNKNTLILQYKHTYLNQTQSNCLMLINFSFQQGCLKKE